ncbi:GNAT family N-acetyltransferase [Sediminibacterium goheungense]|uniref:Ribosomal protein S18 acetylase RimI-like enzyme n=1 Tax=Sediminibacterium goheungense TaxID=1086393 RepID=A0A4R6IZ21_9BACT|nr:GNAT family N-acetyltransferase [Sediminibacterium goheungense]TDO28083.1 ribosomal protein S18 acetylase RimI-like enzyme [Sediminibacterium goheungense]
MSELQIRRATEEDAALIAAISRETFYDSFAAQNTAEDMTLFMERQFDTELLIQEVADEAHIFFLTFYGDTPAGYAKLKPGTHPELTDTAAALEICRFYARKPFIGKGIGKAMMQHAIQYAEANAYHTIWLGVWEHNQRAIDFYRLFGFQKFSEHDFVLGNDVQRDWLMRKEVGCEW